MAKLNGVFSFNKPATRNRPFWGNCVSISKGKNNAVYDKLLGSFSSLEVKV
jgi:hypothetical protein